MEKIDIATELNLTKELFIMRIGKSEHANLLLQWDVISNWARHKEVKTLFFNGSEEPMYQLLMVISIHLGTIPPDSIDDEEMPLFYFFDMYSNTYRAYETIQYLHTQLKYWISDPEIKKMMTFCRFLPDTPFGDLRFLSGCLFMGKNAIYNYLMACKNEIFCEVGITDYPFELYKEALNNQV